ncbi:MAG: hypothetical protein OEZ32_12545 [Nitrospinota bacterium]|nr:hypothetical protein [Nitrospinota bacterium]
MASQAEIIRELNASTDRESQAAASANPKVGRVVMAFRLAVVPSICFLKAYISKGGPRGGASAFRDAVNAWAGAFLKEAKQYEITYADTEKAITESRDFG